MDCQNAEGLVDRYIAKTLDTQTMAEFLEHIESCPSCYQELETSFMVTAAMQHLSDEEDTDLDFRRLLEQDLKRARYHIILSQVLRFLRICLYLLLAAGLTQVILMLIVEVNKLL
ncbi:MAG: zf-HC2 domain-containing protein [Blautia sp.]|nr:zf-HC2 domain-containing protein [Blautia sp.]